MIPRPLLFDNQRAFYPISKESLTLSTYSQMSHAITVSNGGSGATKNIHFTVEKDLADKVVFIEATAGSASDKTYLRVTETKLSSNKVGSLRIQGTSYSTLFDKVSYLYVVC